MITKSTAYDIVRCYQEIEAAEELLKQIGNPRYGEIPDLRDAFGRPRGLQLGVPTSESSHRLYDVSFLLGKTVIETHLCEQNARLRALSLRAKTETETPEQPKPGIKEAQ